MHTLVVLSAIVAAASASWNGAPGWGGAHGGWNGAGWANAPANVVVQNGQVQDTPEVAAEKAKHFALVSEAAARAASSPDTGAYNGDNGQYNGQYNRQWDNSGAWNGDDGSYKGDQGQWNGNQGQWNGAPANNWAGNNGWTGQPAKIVVNNGQVQETPEVAAARAQHLAALQAAGSNSYGAPQPHWG